MKLIGIKEVSEILNVKPSTLYQWAELGQIPCYKINGALRFDIEDIMKWIESCKKEVTSSYNPLAQSQKSQERRSESKWDFTEEVKSSGVHIVYKGKRIQESTKTDNKKACRKNLCKGVDRDSGRQMV